jgi:hypothetical protein
VAMRLYAMQAKDRVLIDHATEIRIRAERRAGELLKQMEKNQGGVAGKTGSKGRPVLDDTPTLSDLNINKSQSSRWQKLAGIDEEEFEEIVAHAKQKASSAVDHAQQPKQKPKRKRPKRDAADVIATCVSEVEMTVRAATRGMGIEEREALLGQLITAIRGILVDATVRDSKADRNADFHRENGADPDRWTEATH